MLRCDRGTRSWALRVQVDPAALPGGAEQQLPDRLHEAAVVIADDQAHARQAAVDQTLDERRPGGALVVARRELEAQHPPLPSATPVATSAAIDTTRPPSRTFT